MTARTALTALLTIGSLFVAAKPSLADPAIYERLVDSSVWIRNIPGQSNGSGIVIDAQNKLVVTNYHVINGATNVEVYFAAFDGDGALVTDKDTYLENARTLQEQGLASMARVVATWKDKDLALIKLEELPTDVNAIPLASSCVAPGEQVHSVGNPGASDALWVYSPGKVRQIFPQRFVYSDGQRVDANLIDVTSPINPGDSGSGLVNSRGELVGVICSSHSRGRMFSQAVEVDQLKDLLNHYYEDADVDMPGTNQIGGWSDNVLVGAANWPQ